VISAPQLQILYTDRVSVYFYPPIRTRRQNRILETYFSCDN